MRPNQDSRRSSYLWPSHVHLSGVLFVMWAAIGLSGCHGAVWGNLIVLMVSVGIFWGTLSLGRGARATRSEASMQSHNGKLGHDSKLGHGSKLGSASKLDAASKVDNPRNSR